MRTVVALLTVVLGIGALPSSLALSRGKASSALIAEKNRPVTKVITLLKDMTKQLEKEGQEDEEVYDKLACWCQTNDKTKTKSIADAAARLEDLTTKIEETSANSAQLTTEIKNLNKEVAANQQALDEATALREKQLGEFNGEEKESLEAISALKAAVTVLSKHQTVSLLQLDATSAATLRRALPRSGSSSSLTEAQRGKVMAFLQAPEGYLEAAPTFKQSYAPQSSEVFGILEQMLETFEANLKSSQQEEQENQKAFGELKVAKEEEIKSGQDLVDSKSKTLADTDEKHAQAKEDVTDTTRTKEADEQFLAMLKEKCSMTDKEWEERQKTRQMEMEAVSKALEYLSSDEAHDLFSRTFNPSLLQRSSSSQQGKRRSAAAALLQKVARKSNFPRLSALAVRVKLDAFEKVKQAIDNLVVQLGKEQADEVKQKDFCVDELNKNQLQTEKKTREQADTAASIEDLTLTIKGFADAIDTLNTEVKDLQVQLNRAGEDREKENQDFQTTISDQKATQKLLKGTLTVLQDFYGKEKGSFVQADPAGPAPPAGFKDYKKNESAGGVLGLIKQIIADAKAMEEEAARAESDAQKAYEDFVKQTNGSLEAKGKDIVNKAEEKAKAEGALTEAKKTSEAVLLTLEQLANTKAQLHQSCDFVTKNFDLRQKARSEEMQALKDAKAILSGANFE